MMIKKEFLCTGCLLLFAFFPIIPNGIKGLPVILLFFISLFFCRSNKINWWWALLNTSLFIVYFISLFYSNNLIESLKKLETALSILILPISFSLINSKLLLTNIIRISFLKLFVYTSGIFSLTSLINLIFNDSYVDYLWKSDRYRKIIEDMPLIGQHPIYASIFLAISIFFSIILLRYGFLKHKKEKLFHLLVLIPIVILLFMLISKGVILSLFIILFFYFLITLKKKIHKYFTLIITVISILILFKASRRMQEVINIDTYESFNSTLSTSIRLGIYECSFQIIKKNWIFGYGIGDAQRQLNLCYANKSDILLMKRFNSHNQYLDIIIKTGIFGGIIFLAFIFFNVKVALESRNEILLLIIPFYVLIFLTENILSRQSGVILFFFLVCFFNNFNLKPNKISDYSKT